MIQCDPAEVRSGQSPNAVKINRISENRQCRLGQRLPTGVPTGSPCVQHQQDVFKVHCPVGVHIALTNQGWRWWASGILHCVRPCRNHRKSHKRPRVPPNTGHLDNNTTPFGFDHKESLAVRRWFARSTTIRDTANGRRSRLFWASVLCPTTGEEDGSRSKIAPPWSSKNPNPETTETVASTQQTCRERGFMGVYGPSTTQESPVPESGRGMSPNLPRSSGFCRSSVAEAKTNGRSEVPVTPRILPTFAN